VTYLDRGGGAVTGVSSTADALSAVGVRDDTLSIEERGHLEQFGYLDLGKLLSDDQLVRIRERIEALLAEEVETAGLEAHREAGSERLADLVNKDPVFDVCFTHPRFLAAAHHLIGGKEMKLSSLNMRSPEPGAGHQGLHVDWSNPVPDGDLQVCNSVWMIDDFTKANGPTRIVPGSHRSPRTPNEELGDPQAAHPEQVLVTGTAGTVVVFSSHIWHGGTVNRTGGPRRGVFSYYTARAHGQQTDQRAHLRPATAARLSPAARYLLDV